MAILHEALAAGGGAAAAAAPPPRTPGLFVATVLPPTIVSAAQPAALLPPAALARVLRARGCAPPPAPGDAQLVVSTETALELLAVDALTETLVRLERVPVFGRVRALARMRLDGGAADGDVDVLLVLAGTRKISFVQWDERSACLACVGSVVLFGMPAGGTADSRVNVRKEAKLLVAHPRKKIAAVATLESTVAVFPVMFLADRISAGKVASVPVEGVVLSMAFLEDEEDCQFAGGDGGEVGGGDGGGSGSGGGGGGAGRGGRGSLSVLIALVQQEKRQFIAVFSIGASTESSAGWGGRAGSGGGGLCIRMVASMSTCAARSEDIAVERIQSKLSGTKVKPPRTASSIAAIPRKPYLFMVCLDGRFVIADARAVVCDIGGVPATAKRKSSLMRPPSGPSRRLPGTPPRPEGDRRDSPAPPRAGTDGGGHADDDREDGNGSAAGSEGISGSHRDRLYGGDQTDERMESEDCDYGSGPSGSVSVNASARSDVASASQFESAAAGSGGALSSCPDGTDSGGEEGAMQFSDEQGLDDEDDDREQDIGPHGSEQELELALELAGERTDEDSNPETSIREHHELSTDAASAEGAADPSGIDSSLFPSDSKRQSKLRNDLMAPRAASLSGYDAYTSYLHMPPNFALDLSDFGEGHAGALTCAGGHFAVAAPGDPASPQGGFYIVMESGSMYALRWQSTMRSDGVPCFVIPRTGGKAADAASGSRSSPFFSIEHVGEVGAASVLAALAGNLLYISGEGSDGTLRFVAFPSAQSSASSALEIRQNFLSLGPLSDMALLSQFDQTRSRHPKRSLRQATGRTQVAPSVGSGSALLRKRKSRSSRDFGSAVTPASGDPLDKGIPLLDSRDSLSELEDKLLVCSGIGEMGTLRILRSGAAFSVFSSSGKSYPSCNGVWSIRTSRRSKYHGFLVLTFAESTGVYCIAPPGLANPLQRYDRSSPCIAELMDGSEASQFRLDCRTIASGLLVDGVLAQIHRDGVRLVQLRKARESDGSLSEMPERRDGFVTGSLAEGVANWHPPPESFIVAGCVGNGHVVVAVRDAATSGTQLFHLKSVDRAGHSPTFEVFSKVSTSMEVSSLALPSWVGDGAIEDGAAVASTFDVVIVTTYAPAVEIRSLSRGLGLVCSQLIDACPSNSVKELTGTGHGIPSKHTLSGAYSEPAGSVPESACGLEFGHRRIVAVGLRDGRAMTFLVSPGPLGDYRDLRVGENSRSHVQAADSSTECLQLLNCRRLGRKPVQVQTAMMPSGSSLLAECERPWAGALVSHACEWTPIQFLETRATTAISFPGAERCLVIVSADGALHIGAVKRLAPMSVSSIRVGATPRRVCSLTSLGYSYAAVATFGGEYDDSAAQVTDDLGSSATGRASDPASKLSQLRVYDLETHAPVCTAALGLKELVHVLLCWRSFVVVGTSRYLPASRIEDVWGDHATGRLLLYSLSGITSSQNLEECCQLVLPGAVLAGAVNAGDECIVVSSNNQIFVFGLTSNGRGLFEIARVSTRMAVVSLSIRQGLVCAADRKDSIVFYRIDVATQELVRCRGDYRKRVVADAVLVDDHTAIAVDRLGHLFSLAYDLRDQVRLPESSLEMSRADIPSRLFGMPTSAEACLDAFDHHSSAAEENDRDRDENSDAGGSLSVPVATTHNPAGDDHEDLDLDAMDAAVAEAEESIDGEGSSSAFSALEDDSEPGAAEEDQVSHNDDGVNAAGNGDGFLIFPGPQPIQRHLVSNHAIGLDDIPLRARCGSLARREQRRLGQGGGVKCAAASHVSFWELKDSCVLTGTVSGSIVACVPLNLQEAHVLHKLSVELVRRDGLLGSAIGASHEEYRRAYGSQPHGALDGDLLFQFCSLPRCDQDALALAAGFPGSKSALAFAELIQSLWDRVR